MQLIKKTIRQILIFGCSQYLILFFIATIGIKLAYFNTYIIKVTWPSNQYWYGIIFGFISVAVLFTPLYFVNKYKNRFAILVATIISVILLIDTVYYSYFAALPSVGLLNSIGQSSGVGPAILSLLHWQLVLYFADIIIAINLYKPTKALMVKIKDRYFLKIPNIKNSIMIATITIIAFLLALLPMGLTKLNDVIDRGYDTVSTAQYYGLLMAHVVDIVRFIEEETTHLSAAQETTLANWVKANKTTQITDNMTGLAKGKNVIMIQVESLGGFVINKTINDKEITPTLNSLSATSQFFPNNHFVIGAGHTSDTDFVANTSYFPLTDAAVFVRYGQDDFTSLPKTLVANGYSAYAYHGYNRNFWNRNTAISSLGYQKFYAADNYPKGAMINLGLNDGDFLAKTAEYIKNQPKPSLSYAITLSSHVPFAITDQTKDLGVDINNYPDQVGGYLENIHYVDNALGAFFTKLKAEGLYDDSLIVVYGDHTPVLPAFTAGDITYDPTSVQGKEVPLIIKLPQETVGKTYYKQATSLDITPTIFDLLGIKTNQLMFGQSLFARSSDNALKVCVDQLVVFSESDNCTAKLTEERNKSAEIIRYNQFTKL